MATAIIRGASLKDSDITECAICIDTFKYPKLLPCIHTFCLPCLETYCKDKKGDELSCPLCRKVFTIPSGGVQNFSNNFFIHQLLQVTKSTVTTETQISVNPVLCQLCSDTEVRKTSRFYCIQCEKNICDRCSVIHTTAKKSMSHHVVHNADISSAEDRIKMTENCCNRQWKNTNRLYCYDCKSMMCLMCASQHSQHKVSDVSELVKEFKEQRKDYADKAAACATNKQLEFNQLLSRRDKFLNNVASAESMITNKCDELISRIQSHRNQLMEKLTKFKKTVLEEIGNKKAEIETSFVVMDSFNTYSLEVVYKGTAWDICRTTRDLRARAEELVIVSDCNEVGAAVITFKSALATTTSANNLIGELICTDLSKQFKIPLFLLPPQLLGVIPGGGSIYGLTVLRNQLFVVRSGSAQVSVYNTNNFTLTRKLTITGSLQLRAIVASPRHNCLYISDTLQNVIYRYNLSDNVISSWSVEGECYGLSLTSTHNVLATLYDTKAIREYTPVGNLVRVISLDSTIKDPWHSVQLSKDQFVVSHGKTGSIHRTCVVDPSGRIIRCYGGSEGSGVGQLRAPTNLAVDRLGNVLVADQNNHRIVLLSSSQTHLGYIALSEQSRPSALYLDLPTQRLYIGDSSSVYWTYLLSYKHIG